MKRLLIMIAFFIFLANADAQSQRKDSVILQTASTHPMQYYVSLPDGWTKEKQWPVVLVIEAADKEYRENALRFVRARKKMPFIIVAPYNVNNSRSGRRDPAVFPYTSKTGDDIE
jgi:hypothetical protein